jgi:hypothetical protein
MSLSLIWAEKVLSHVDLLNEVVLRLVQAAGWRGWHYNCSHGWSGLPSCLAMVTSRKVDGCRHVCVCVCVCVFHLYVYFVFCLYAQAYLRVVEAGDNWHCCAYEALDCWYAAQTVCIQTPVVDHMHPHASSILLHPHKPKRINSKQFYCYLCYWAVLLPLLQLSMWFVCVCVCTVDTQVDGTRQ